MKQTRHTILFVFALLLISCAPSPAAPANTVTMQNTIQPPAPTQSPLPTPVQNAAAQAEWRADLQLLAEEMPKRHPDLFFGISQADFEQAISDLDQRIPTLSDTQITVEFLKIVASISQHGRDGHTVLRPSPLHLYPLQFYLFSDGLFVIDAQQPYESLIGSQAVKIGDTDFDAVFQMYDPLLSRDNEMTVRWTMPTMLLFAEVAVGLGLIDDVAQGSFLLEDAQGKQSTANVTPISREDYSSWKALGPNTLPPSPTPLYLSNIQERFWFTFLEDTKTLYIQYNAVQAKTQSGESIAQFSQRIDEFADQNSVERIVIDLRHNNGGNNTTYRPLINVLSQNEAINQASKLFTIIGRQTFSAAGNFATDMERATHTLFAGEPTGGSPNQYGDTKPLLLPNSQIIVNISSRYWQKSDADDERLWIAADLPVELSSTDYFSNHDPVMTAILNYSP